MKRATAEKLCEQITTATREVLKAWDESLHPRDENGRFTSGGGGSSTSFTEHTPGSYTDDADDVVRASSRFVGDDNLKNQAKDYLNHHLGPNDDWCTVDAMRIIQNPTSSGIADVEVEYTVDMEIPVGIDHETGRMEYDSDTDYRSQTLQLKVWN